MDEVSEAFCGRLRAPQERQPLLSAEHEHAALAFAHSVATTLRAVGPGAAAVPAAPAAATGPGGAATLVAVTVSLAIPLGSLPSSASMSQEAPPPFARPCMPAAEHGVETQLASSEEEAQAAEAFLADAVLASFSSSSASSETETDLGSDEEVGSPPRVAPPSPSNSSVTYLGSGSETELASGTETDLGTGTETELASVEESGSESGSSQDWTTTDLGEDSDDSPLPRARGVHYLSRYGRRGGDRMESPDRHGLQSPRQVSSSTDGRNCLPRAAPASLLVWCAVPNPTHLPRCW